MPVTATSSGATANASGDHAGDTLPLARRLKFDALMIGILALINLICFSRTLSGYFLADDFIHIPFLYQVFHGHPELLWGNFTSNWMQAQGTQFYRPFISLTLAFDYLLWGTNAFGYHLSNTLYQAAASIFLFLTTRRILMSDSPSTGTQHARISAAALFAGALFAAYPLHPEVVSWVIGRVDSVCTAFFLAAFWLLLKAEQDKVRWAKIAGLLSFAIALISKEMAITLPATLSLYFLFCSPSGTKLKERLAYSMGKSWDLWAMLGGYIILRSLAIGTISGGYAGAIGEGLSQSLFKRWFEEGSLSKFLLPLNAELFGPGDALRKLLRALYIASGISIGSRFMIQIARPSYKAGFSKFIWFSAGWFVLSMMPTYQVWNLTDSLQGSRFAYMATAPLCVFLSLLLFPLTQPGFMPDEVDRRIDRLCTISCAALLALLVWCFGSITWRNNIPWAHAGNQVRKIANGN